MFCQELPRVSILVLKVGGLYDVESPTGSSYTQVRGKGGYASVIPVRFTFRCHCLYFAREGLKIEKRARNLCAAVVLGMQCDC